MFYPGTGYGILAVMVGMDSIREFAYRIASEFRAERIILFGSYAYGTPHERSDVDLLVVMPFQGNAFDCATQVLRRIRSPFSLDLLIRRPADTARRYREFDPLIRDALDRGKVLYERNRKRVGRQGGGRPGKRSSRTARPQIP